MKEDYEIQVGDTIVAKTAFGINKHKVHRVTKKYAFVKFNEISEGKYSRIYNMWFSLYPKSKYMSLVTYDIIKGE